MAYQKVCLASDLAPGKVLKIEIAGQGILLYNDENQVKAHSSACLHRGGDLSGGEIETNIITCPLHFWKFDLRNGICVQVPTAALKAYPAKIENDAIWVDAESLLTP
jgi:nitrite reductase/ring-hydroxylating ferredoxin subunit